MNASYTSVSRPKIEELRAFLATHPLSGWSCRRPVSSRKQCGVAVLDAVLEGGLVPGKLYEALTGTIGSGSATLISALLRSMEEQQRWTALVDGSDSFNPSSLGKRNSKMLWVRCRQAVSAIKATDLLLRDRNLELIILDVALNPPAQLNKIPASTWFRFQRLMEMSATTLLVLTSRRLVSSARTSFRLNHRFNLEALEMGEDKLLEALQIKVVTERFDLPSTEGQPLLIQGV